MAKDVKQLEINGEEYGIKDSTARDLVEASRTPHTGRDLTEVFAEEIKEYDDEWAWIAARIKAADFTGICNGDWLPLTVNGYTYEMQANIDTYYSAQKSVVGHHIDFISRDCYREYVVWKEDGSNNGTSSNRSPYMASDVKTWLNDTLYGLLPENVQKLITDKYTYAETRYSSSGTLTDSTSYAYVNLGKLWLLDEVEVTGMPVWSTPIYGNLYSVQYPVFANSHAARIKGYGPGGDADYWWLRSVVSGSGDGAVLVVNDGSLDWYYVDRDNMVPLCFRIS